MNKKEFIEQMEKILPYGLQNEIVETHEQLENFKLIGEFTKIKENFYACPNYYEKMLFIGIGNNVNFIYKH